MKGPIYSIGIGQEVDFTPGVVSFVGPSTTAGGEQTANAGVLRELAKETGGESFLVGIGSKDNSLKQATTAIARKITNKYTVGFVGDRTTSQLQFEIANQSGTGLKIDTH